MNKPEHHDLIEGLLTAETAEHAPSENDVLRVARAERHRRTVRNGALGVAAALGLGLFALRGNRAEPEPLAVTPPPVPAKVEPAVAASPPEPSGRIPRLTDEEMLDFLGDAPVALVTRGDGSRALIMLTGAR